MNLEPKNLANSPNFIDELAKEYVIKQDDEKEDGGKLVIKEVEN